MSITLLYSLLILPNASQSFILSGKAGAGYINSNISTSSRGIKLNSSAGDMDAETAKLLADAKALLEKAKEIQKSDKEVKMEKGIKDKDEKRKSVTKQVMEDTGLITTDGDLMAEMSEEEEWSERSLVEVFADETFDDDEDFNEALLDRDVAASVNGMRVRMDNKDFETIFDARNIFIGENR